MFAGLLVEVAHDGNRIRGGYTRVLHASRQLYRRLHRVRCSEDPTCSEGFIASGAGKNCIYQPGISHIRAIVDSPVFLDIAVVANVVDQSTQARLYLHSLAAHHSGHPLDM